MVYAKVGLTEVMQHLHFNQYLYKISAKGNPIAPSSPIPEFCVFWLQAFASFFQVVIWRRLSQKSYSASSLLLIMTSLFLACVSISCR
jgi:hypothetical protein